LIADALGARVYRNLTKEIGWFPFDKNIEIEGTLLKGTFDDTQVVFHWHGDTFDIPPGAIRIGSSKACLNQGFIYQDRVLALQFHLEMTDSSIRTIIEHSKNELMASLSLIPENRQYIQDESTMMEQISYVKNNQALMSKVLNCMGII